MLALLRSLRHQLIILRRKVPRRVCSLTAIGWLLVQLYRLFPSILQALTIIRPVTLVRWHRAGFRRYWRRKSASRLCNHAPDIAAMDLFVVSTISFSLFYALVIVRLDRRELVWVNVTAEPTAEWIARQITEAFPWDDAPQYLVRDRDRIYGTVFTRRLRAIGIRDKPIAPTSPWQNGFAERLIGSVRRECVDHLIVLGEAHLRRILRAYARYYNDIRTHWSLAKDAPVSRPTQRIGSIRSQAILGRLHHHYVRV
jgi:transposase InsO family protein